MNMVRKQKDMFSRLLGLYSRIYYSLLVDYYSLLADDFSLPEQAMISSKTCSDEVFNESIL